MRFQCAKVYWQCCRIPGVSLHISGIECRNRHNECSMIEQNPSADQASVEILGAGRFLRLVSEDGWERAERVGTKAVVCVIAVSTDRELILTEQYRPALKCRVLDLPAGLAGDRSGHHDEDLDVAAARELYEETGFHAERLERWITLPTSPGLTDEAVTYFCAPHVERRAAGGGDESEGIAVICAPLNGMDAWLMERNRQGIAIDPKVFVALYWLRQLAR